MRHAGSGTLATLDWGIMKGNGWGTSLVNAENRSCNSVDNGGPGSYVPGCAGGAYVYFNDGTSDAQNCLKWAAGNPPAATPTGDTPDQLDPGQEGGAIGYWDADYANSTGNYVQIMFNGVAANRVTMHDGIYDNFWTVNRMYVPAGLSSWQGVIDIYADMIKALNNPADINNKTVGNARASTYGAKVELNHPKPSSPGYPWGYTPASDTAMPD
jgi:hypothetical protein